MANDSKEQGHDVIAFETPSFSDMHPEISKPVMQDLHQKPAVKPKPQIPKKPAFLMKSSIVNQEASHGEQPQEKPHTDLMKEKLCPINIKTSDVSIDQDFTEDSNRATFQEGNVSESKQMGKEKHSVVKLDNERTSANEMLMSKNGKKEGETDDKHQSKVVARRELAEKASDESIIPNQDSKTSKEMLHLTNDVSNCFEDAVQTNKELHSDGEGNLGQIRIPQASEQHLMPNEMFLDTDKGQLICKDSSISNDKKKIRTMSKPRPVRPPPPPPKVQKYPKEDNVELTQLSDVGKVSNDCSVSNTLMSSLNDSKIANVKKSKHTVTTIPYETSTLHGLMFQEKEVLKGLADKNSSEKPEQKISALAKKNNEYQKFGLASENSSSLTSSEKHLGKMCLQKKDEKAMQMMHVVTRENGVDLRKKKENRKSCPPPETMNIEAKEEIKGKVEMKWKYRSFGVNSQSKEHGSPKPELLQRLQELKKRSEISDSKVSPQSEMLPVIKDDVDEDLEDAVFFDYVLVVKLRKGESGLEPYISFRFPPKQKYDKEKDGRVASIPQFCFPDLKAGMSAGEYLEQHVGFSSSETFSFVLTDMVGQRHFGYCRQIQVKKERTTESSLPEVYCIVSPYGLFGLYSQILDEVEHQCAFSSSHVFVFLKAVLSHSLPRAGGSIKVSFYSGDSKGLKSLTLKREADSAVHEHVDLSLLFENLPVSVILSILVALILERRIILASSQLSLLSACCHGFVSLLYPFVWQHTYIPVLPYALVDMCCLPTPYLLGILSGCLPEIEDLPIDEAIIVDLDQKMILKDLDVDNRCNFPSLIRSKIETDLTIGLEAGHSPRTEKMEKNAVITEVFVDAYLILIGNFTNFLSPTCEGGFEGTEFYRSAKSKEIKRFLKAFIKTQAFQEFTRCYQSTSKKRDGLFENKLLAWQQSGKNRGAESVWHKFKGKLRAGHK